LDKESDINNIFNSQITFKPYNIVLPINRDNKSQQLLPYMKNILYGTKSRECVIPRSNVLNENLKNNNFNICKSYFNEYKNNLDYEQFKSQSRYFNNTNIDTIIDKFIHSNRNISKPNTYKYKLIHNLNNIYQCIDKKLNIVFV
jgi:hypothetical protein